MDRTRFIEHKGRRVVLLDYTNLTEETETVREIEKSRQFIAANLQPDGQGFTLTDGTGARYTAAVLEALKKLAAHNKPYIKAGAAVSDSRLHRVVISSVAVFTGRRIPVFATREEALEYLMQH